MIRLIGGIGGGSRDRMDSDAEAVEIVVGSKVEARYAGKDKYYPGEVTRVRLNGTYDIAYDNGEREVEVQLRLVRLAVVQKRRTGAANEFRIGDRIEGQYQGKLRWLPGKISRVCLDGTYEVEYDNGNDEVGVDADRLRLEASLDQQGRRMGAADVSRRLAYFESAAKKKQPQDDVVLHSKGKRVASYWYRTNSYGRPSRHTEPKSATVICYNSDATYTIEMDSDKMILDDVAEEHLKDWSEANHDLHRRHAEIHRFDPWAAVFVMAGKMAKQQKLSHSVPSPEIVNNESYSSKEILNHILGKSLVEDFRDIFTQQDRYDDGELSSEAVLKGFKALGADVNESELRDWMKKSNLRQKSFDFTDFVLAYANVLYPLDPSRDKNTIEGLGQSLRLDSEWRDMSSFARNFGKKLLRELERSFDRFAVKDPQGVSRMPAGDIIEAFHSIGRAVTVTRLQEWMMEVDVRPQDTLSLADFASVFAFFFHSSAKADTKPSAEEAPTARMSLADIAIQTMREERWRATPEQTVAFVRRLCVGRSTNAVDVISRLRDAFEALDQDAVGEVSTSDLYRLMHDADIKSPLLETPMRKFNERLVRQARGRFSLPEVFEHLGPFIQDIAEASVGVDEAFSMVRLYLASSDVRAAADLALKIIDNMILHKDDSKYWQVNVRSEVRHLVVHVLAFIHLYHNNNRNLI